MCCLETKMKTNKKEKITTDLEIPKAKITYVHNVKTLLSSIGDKQKECNRADYNATNRTEDQK